MPFNGGWIFILDAMAAKCPPKLRRLGFPPEEERVSVPKHLLEKFTFGCRPKAKAQPLTLKPHDF